MPKSNVAAIQFYNQDRFQIANLLPKFHTDGEDGIEMRQHI